MPAPDSPTPDQPPDPVSADPGAVDPVSADPVTVDSETVAEIVGGAPDPDEIERVEAEERYASQRLATIAAGRRKGGLAGAAMAGAMLGLRDFYEGPPKDDTIVAIVESPDEPVDIDTDGIEVSVGDVDVWAPPPVRRDGAAGDQLDD